MTFSEQVDAVLKGEFPFYSALLVCETPELLVQLGCKRFPMLYTQRHLKNAVTDKDPRRHCHGLTIEQIKQLPEHISEPAIIFDSVTRADSIVVVFDAVDFDGFPIIATIKPNGTGRLGKDILSANFITSVYGRHGFQSFVSGILPKDNILFVSKEKSQALFRRWGLQLPELINNLDFNIIIHQSRNNVNRNIKNGEGILMENRYFAGDIIKFADENGIARQYAVIEAGKNHLSCFCISDGAKEISVDLSKSDAKLRFVCDKVQKIVIADEKITLSSIRLEPEDVLKLIEKHNHLSENKQLSISAADVKSDIISRRCMDIAENFKLSPDTIADYMQFKSRFTAFSNGNLSRLYAQNEGATFVKTFKQWKDEGYIIKRGEKGIQLRSPNFTEKFRDADGKIRNVSEATNSEKSKIASGEYKTWTKQNYGNFTVFDIAQTNCPVNEYPKFFRKGYESEMHADIFKVLKQFAENQGIRVTVEDTHSIALEGYYEPKTDRIVISDRLRDTERMHTMAHELAHAVMHKTTTQSEAVCEFEADCLSAQLAGKFGFTLSETSRYHLSCAFRRIPENQKIEESFDRVGKAFDFVNKGFEHTAQEMGISFEQQRTEEISAGKAVAVAPETLNFSQA